MDIALTLLIAFGVVYVVVDSAIFAPVRLTLAARSALLETFLYCAYCVGFWVGFGLDAAWSQGVAGWSPWDWALAIINAVKAGAIVMGAIAVGRAIAPSFLMGAYERERRGIELLQGRGDGGADRGGDGGEEGPDD